MHIMTKKYTVKNKGIKVVRDCKKTKMKERKKHASVR